MHLLAVSRSLPVAPALASYSFGYAAVGKGGPTCRNGSAALCCIYSVLRAAFASAAGRSACTVAHLLGSCWPDRTVASIVSFPEGPERPISSDAQHQRARHERSTYSVLVSYQRSQQRVAKDRPPLKNATAGAYIQ